MFGRVVKETKRGEKNLRIEIIFLENQSSGCSTRYTGSSERPLNQAGLVIDENNVLHYLAEIKSTTGLIPMWKSPNESNDTGDIVSYKKSLKHHSTYLIKVLFAKTHLLICCFGGRLKRFHEHCCLFVLFQHKKKKKKVW